MTIKNTHNMKDGQTFIIKYTKKMAKKLKEMRNLFLANVENIFQKLAINFLHILMLTNPITRVEINTEVLEIVGRLNNVWKKERHNLTYLFNC